MCLQVQLRYTVVLSARLLFAISLCSSLLFVLTCAEVPRGKRPSSLAVQLPGGDDALARDIAARYGYTLITKVGRWVGGWMGPCTELRDVVE